MRLRRVGRRFVGWWSLKRYRIQTEVDFHDWLVGGYWYGLGLAFHLGPFAIQIEKRCECREVKP